MNSSTKTVRQLKTISSQANGEFLRTVIATRLLGYETTHSIALYKSSGNVDTCFCAVNTAPTQPRSEHDTGWSEQNLSRHTDGRFRLCVCAFQSLIRIRGKEQKKHTVTKILQNDYETFTFLFKCYSLPLGQSFRCLVGAKLFPGSLAF